MRKFIFTYKSRGLGQAKPEPSREWRLWPGLRFEEAKAASGQAKAGAFRPSRAGTALHILFPPPPAPNHLVPDPEDGDPDEDAVDGPPSLSEVKLAKTRSMLSNSFWGAISHLSLK